MDRNPYVEIARLWDDSPADTGLALLTGRVTRDMEHDGEVQLQADGLTLDADDLIFASGLRAALQRGGRVLLARSSDGQAYYALLRLEG